MERMLGEVDVRTDEDLRQLGSVAAYGRLKFRFGRHVTLLALYGMEAALRDCHWQAIDAETKAALKAEFGVLGATQK